MKYCFWVFAIIATIVVSKGRADELSAGLAVMNKQAPYVGFDSKTRVVPAIQYQTEKWQIRGITFSYQPIKFESIDFSLIVTPEFAPFEIDDSDVFLGMEERNHTLTAGFSISKRLSMVNLSYRFQQDLFNAHQGNKQTLSLSTRLPLTERLWLMPSAYASLWSSKVANYYFGVTAQEVNDQRSEYQLDGQWLTGVRLSFLYSPASDWQGHLSIGYRDLGDEIATSPLVAKTTETDILLSLLRRF